MANKYKFDTTAYKRRLEKEKEVPAFRERIKEWEKYIKDQPEFGTEADALTEACEMTTKKGEECAVYQAPKELGGNWKVISYEDHGGRAPDAADMLGWCVIYDRQMLYDRTEVDEIEEV